jgi:Family of unknown function (DUF6161)
VTSRWIINVPEQGVNETLTDETTRAFFQDEVQFYNRLQSLLNENVTLIDRGLGQARIHNSAIQAINNIANSLDKNNKDPFEEYIKAAHNLEIVIGHGVIGKQVEELIQSGKNHEAKWIMLLMSSRWIGNPQLEQLIAPLRASIRGNPASSALSSLSAIGQATQDAEASRIASDTSAKALSSFIEQKKLVFDQLEDVYRRKLVMEEPAKLWKDISARRTRAWMIWLVIFSAMIIGPLVLAILYWEIFIDDISKVTAGNTGGISLSGLAAVTVPALYYAWLLKSISRIVIQNLNFADDAAHRRALAITYLALAENPKLSVSEQDRALILNALFRPTPSQSLDEGPPSGLIDLIKSKP